MWNWIGNKRTKLQQLAVTCRRGKDNTQEYSALSRSEGSKKAELP